MRTIHERQRELAERLVEDVVRTRPDRDTLWNLNGTVGSGKTTILQIAQTSLWEKKLIPVTVNAPHGEADAGPIALLEIVDQLEGAHLVNGERSVIDDPRIGWSQKLETITTSIERNHTSIVLLCDEPALWYGVPHASLEDTPEHCARSLAEWLARGPTCRRILSGRLDEDVPILRRVRAPKLEDGRSLLVEPELWFSVGSVATDLFNGLTDKLQDRSFWEVKLYVALARFKPIGVVAEQANEGMPVRALLGELLDLVQSEEHHHFRLGLARLALSRTPLSLESFHALTGDLNSLDRDLIRACLCVREDTRFGLHPLLRHEVIHRARDSRRSEKNKLWRLPATERRIAHQTLQAEFTSDDRNTLRSELESLHHECLGGTETLASSDSRLRFVEQLHQLGKTLSYGFGEHRRAADLFRLALEFDPAHPYSHHYLAFNLDWLGQQTSEVEMHYQKAIELQPTHPWWWSRWVSYLATRGRFREARSAWQSALDALSVGEEGASDWIYFALHRCVARWLLHWAELDFAEAVLRSIPETLAEGEMSIQALWNLLRALRIAEQGPAVFPLTVPIIDWWSANGHTGLPLTWDDHPMRHWKPARIEVIDQQSGRIQLVVASRPEKVEAPLDYHDLELSQAQVEQAAHNFSWSELKEGHFLELAYYGPENLLQIGLHQITEYRDPHLIPLVPPPDRWYQHAIDAAWDPPGGKV